jgi:hypothetical protein
MQISPSDIAIVITASLLINSERESKYKCALTKMEALHLLCFLSDNITTGKAKQYLSVTSYLKEISSFLSIESETYFTLRHALTVEHVDELMHVMENSTLFQESSGESPNGLQAPNIIKSDSIIGLYLRSINIKWLALRFDELCVLYETYHDFLNKDFKSNDTENMFENIDEAFKLFPFRIGQNYSEIPPISTSNVGSVSTPQYHMLHAEYAIMNNDILPAVDSVHKYFDHNNQNPLASRSSISNMISQLESLKMESKRKNVCYQQAMLSLASLWIKTYQYSQATIAVEEAMKMAHQRGDHASVAHALLLLYYIVEIMPEDNTDGVISAENVITRCIQRCINLKLRELEIQATILLVRLRLKGSINCMSSCLGVGKSDDDMVNAHLDTLNISSLYDQRVHLNEVVQAYNYRKRKMENIIHAHFLWAILSSTQLDETILSIGSANSLSKSSSANSAASRPNNTQGNASNNRSESSKFVNRWGIYEVMVNKAHAMLVASDFWCRLGMYSMALQCNFRALYLCGDFIGTEDLVHICIRICDILCKIDNNDSIICLAEYVKSSKYLNNYRLKEIQCAVRKAEYVGKIALDFIPTCKPAKLYCLVESSKLLVSIRLRLLSNVSYDAIYGDVLRLMENTIEFRHVTDAHFTAIVMKCIVESHYNIKSAIEHLNTLLSSSLCASNIDRYGEVMIALASIQAYVGNSYDVVAALNTVDEALGVANIECLPVVDVGLSIIVKDINKILYNN